MCILHFHNELQLCIIPHLDCAVVADTVQKVLVPNNGGDPVLVGLLPGTRLCQLSILANLPCPEIMSDR